MPTCVIFLAIVSISAYVSLLHYKEKLLISVMFNEWAF